MKLDVSTLLPLLALAATATANAVPRRALKTPSMMAPAKRLITEFARQTTGCAAGEVECGNGCIKSTQICCIGKWMWQGGDPGLNQTALTPSVKNSTLKQQAVPFARPDRSASMVGTLAARRVTNLAAKASPTATPRVKIARPPARHRLRPRAARLVARVARPANRPTTATTRLIPRELALALALALGLAAQVVRAGTLAPLRTARQTMPLPLGRAVAPSSRLCRECSLFSVALHSVCGCERHIDCAHVGDMSFSSAVARRG